MSGFACFLRNEALIHLRGSKIPEFLQGQLTCDTRKLSLSQPLMGALCNVKGRVLSDCIVLQLSDSHTALRLRKSVSERFASTLQRYAQFSKISVDLDKREDAIIGVRDAGEPSPATPQSQSAISAGLERGVISLSRSAQHGELISIDPQNPANLASIGAGAREDLEARWAMETLRSGHYALELEDSEAFTPQALNYDLRGLIAFDKGCYTGQEIVARLHYKGQSKRRLRVFQAPHTQDLIARDTPLLNSEGKSVGRCLRIETAPDTHRLVAAEVLNDHLTEALYLTGGVQLTPPTAN